MGAGRPGLIGVQSEERAVALGPSDALREVGAGGRGGKQPRESRFPNAES